MDRQINEAEALHCMCNVRCGLPPLALSANMRVRGWVRGSLDCCIWIAVPVSAPSCMPWHTQVCISVPKWGGTPCICCTTYAVAYAADWISLERACAGPCSAVCVCRGIRMSALSGYCGMPSIRCVTNARTYEVRHIRTAHTPCIMPCCRPTVAQWGYAGNQGTGY